MMSKAELFSKDSIYSSIVGQPCSAASTSLGYSEMSRSYNRRTHSRASMTGFDSSGFGSRRQEKSNDSYYLSMKKACASACGVPSALGGGDFDDSNDDSLFPKFGHFVKTGTSTMACLCRGAVVIGADSRSSTGVYVANRLADKLQRVTDHIYVLRSGSTAHTQNIIDWASMALNSQLSELGGDSKYPRVESAAKLLSSIIYANKDWISASITIAGYDDVKGPQLYNIALGGTLAGDLPYVTAGSGSTFIYAYTDSRYRPDMSIDETRQFIKDSLSRATFRDGSSGGVIRTMVITKDGLHRDASTIPSETGPFPQ